MFLIYLYLQNTSGCHTSKRLFRCEAGRCPYLLFIFDVTVVVGLSLEIELLAQYGKIMRGCFLSLVRSFFAFLSFCHLSLYLSLHVCPFLSLSFFPVSLLLHPSPCHLSLYLSRYSSLPFCPCHLSLYFSTYTSLPFSAICPCISLATTPSLSVPVICPCISLPTRLSLSLPYVPVSLSLQLPPFLSLSFVPVSFCLHVSPFLSLPFVPVSLSLPLFLSLHFSHFFFLSFISVSLSLHLSFSPPAIRHQEPQRPCSPQSLVPLLHYTTQPAETGSLVYSFLSHLSGSGRSHLIKY